MSDDFPVLLVPAGTASLPENVLSTVSKDDLCTLMMVDYRNALEAEHDRISARVQVAEARLRSLVQSWMSDALGVLWDHICARLERVTTALRGLHPGLTPPASYDLPQTLKADDVLLFRRPWPNWGVSLPRQDHRSYDLPLLGHILGRLAEHLPMVHEGQEQYTTLTHAFIQVGYQVGAVDMPTRKVAAHPITVPLALELPQLPPMPEGFAEAVAAANDEALLARAAELRALLSPQALERKRTEAVAALTRRALMNSGAVYSVPSLSIPGSASE